MSCDYDESGLWHLKFKSWKIKEKFKLNLYKNCLSKLQITLIR